MVDVEDDEVAWIWIRHRSRPAKGITGKILFFSPSRETLIEIGRQEIAEQGFAHAKVSRALEGSQTDYVLCLYDTGPERVAEVRHRHPEARCPGWKSDAATERGEYSQKYLRSLRRPAQVNESRRWPAVELAHVHVEHLPYLSLQEALAVVLRDESVRRKLRSTGSDNLITALVRSEDGSRRRTTRGTMSPQTWRSILGAWESGDREQAAELFEELWGDWLPGFSEVENLVLGERRPPGA